MNYLAHLFLAKPTPRSRIGNLLGDFRRGLDLDACCPEVRQGIIMHQHIDAFTDRHPIVHQSKQFCLPHQRRFAGIILDVLYDHFLAKHWPEYADISLEDFAIAMYHTLQNHHDLLPLKLQRALPNMVTENWLCSYRELASVQDAIQRISQRFKRPTSIVAGYAELIQSYTTLESLFQQFFPELIRYARSIK